MYDFSRKIFLILCSINWPNFNVWLSVLLEILDNMRIAIICFPGCVVMVFEINIIAFGCNAKSFASSLLFFFFFSFSSMLLDGLSKIVFRNVSWFVKQEACNQDRTYFIGHTKKCFRKNYSLTCYSRRVWHMVYNVRYKK